MKSKISRRSEVVLFLFFVPGNKKCINFGLPQQTNYVVKYEIGLARLDNTNLLKA